MEKGFYGLDYSNCFFKILYIAALYHSDNLISRKNLHCSYLFAGMLVETTLFGDILVVVSSILSCFHLAWSAFCSLFGSLSSFFTHRQLFYPSHCVRKNQLILIVPFSQGCSIEKSQHDAQSDAFWWSSQRQFTGIFWKCKILQFVTWKTCY